MTEQMLACAMIVRDDADTLEACLQSIRPFVDMLVVVDTGSEDASLDIAEAYADIHEVYTDCNDPETGLIVDFANARNRALTLCEGDWMVWVDADDVVESGREFGRVATETQIEGPTRFLVPYEYDFDDGGRCTKIQSRERMVYPREQFEWIKPVHESLVVKDGPCFDIPVSSITFKHRAKWSTKKRELGRNLRILERHIARVGEADPSCVYYIGKEYARFGDLGAAERYFRRRTELPGMEEERCSAALFLCRIYRAWGAFAESEKWGLQALTFKPWPEPYFELGRTYRAMAEKGDRRDYNFRRAAHFISVGLNLHNDGLFECDPRERFRIHEDLALSLNAVGDLDGAVESCALGLTGDPMNAELRRLQSVLFERQQRTTMDTALDRLVSVGAIDIAQAKVARSVLNGEIALLRDKPPEEEPPPVPVVPAEHGLDIVFYVGPGLEQWNPVTLRRQGMGGSETMVVDMSERLASRGHRVRVFGSCSPAHEGIFKGVEYRDASHFHGLDCDVLIASRTPEAVDQTHRVSSRVRLLWVHDAHCGDRLTLGRTNRFDRILGLTEWHISLLRDTYPWIHDSKLVQTRNGIDLGRFATPVERDPHKAIWSSSADRGLLLALQEWPRIREQVEDAELHVFYGFENWEATARMMGDAQHMRAITHLRRLIRTTEGVVHHGRVSGARLAQEMMTAGVWAYPTHFAETSCLGAMEAQAAGLRIVTSPLAALNETAGDRAAMIPFQWGSPEYRERFIREVVDAMTWPDQGDRSERQRYAREHFDIEDLADEWGLMLRQLVKEQNERTVPQFEEAV